jgi:hypothetical protein
MAQTTSWQPIDLSGHVGTDLETARAALTKAGVNVGAPLPTPGPLAMVYQVLALSTQAWPGAVVHPVTIGSTVVGFKIDPQDQIQAIQQQVIQLQRGGGTSASVAAATPRSTRRPQAPRKDT